MTRREWLYAYIRVTAHFMACQADSDKLMRDVARGSVSVKQVRAAWGLTD